ncbi:hypothetical protein DFQ27_001675 [Actinomortierella ambigua]|uniref:BTB domain-containing protein n=1 Tax=Actinomortierella ambigua TaxID=1343610 RepID=A0A9P6U850_9FUNG|nr:hypothetical protein DFQ27_001675 [Actinomortierella ambigua]
MPFSSETRLFPGRQQGARTGDTCLTKIYPEVIYLIRLVLPKIPQIDQVLLLLGDIMHFSLRQSWKEAAEEAFRKPNIEPSAFDLPLRYMYTGKIEMKMNALIPVVDAARELQLTQLVAAYEYYGCQAVGMETVYDLLLLADRNDLKNFWTGAINFFCNWAEKL